MRTTVEILADMIASASRDVQKCEHQIDAFISKARNADNDIEKRHYVWRARDMNRQLRAQEQFYQLLHGAITVRWLTQKFPDLMFPEQRKAS